jgi:hypothetical protein
MHLKCILIYKLLLWVRCSRLVWLILAAAVDQVVPMHSVALSPLQLSMCSAVVTIMFKSPVLWHPSSLNRTNRPLWARSRAETMLQGARQELLVR